MSHPLFDKHSKTLQDAVAATRSRTYWSAYPEIPSGKIYGETAKGDAKQAFESRLNNTFALDLPGASGTVGSEASPFGIELNISYPKCDLSVLLTAAEHLRLGTVRSRLARARDDLRSLLGDPS